MTTTIRSPSEEPSPIKRMMLQAALRKAGITRAEFPAWYQDTLGKPFVRLEIDDVKPLLNAAYRAVDERRLGYSAHNRHNRAETAPGAPIPPEIAGTPRIQRPARPPDDPQEHKVHMSADAQPGDRPLAKKFRKKPVIIEAVQWDERMDTCDLLESMGMRWTRREGNKNAPEKCTGLYIKTLEGSLHASMGDWIIKRVKGEFYPCKPDVFEATYEPV